MTKEGVGTSERYGQDPEHLRRTGRECDGLGAVPVLSFIGQLGEEREEEEGCDIGFDGLLGGTVTTADEDATGESGSDGNAPRLQECVFRKLSRRSPRAGFIG